MNPLLLRIVLCRRTWLMSALLMIGALPASERPAFPGDAVTPPCDAACLEGFANRYLAA
jgi:hypothetical protein